MARPRRTSAASETSSMPEQNQVRFPATCAFMTNTVKEMSSLYDYLCKIILLGPSGSGKFVRNEWRILSSQTIGVEFASQIVKVGTGANRKRVKLQLWDTAGTERFRSVSRSYYRGAAGAILIYDVASIASFNALPTFLMDARALASPHLTTILAGNKVDLADPRSAITTESATTPSSASSRHSSFPFDAGGSVKSRSESLMAGSKLTATKAEGREVSPDIVSKWASRSNVPVTMEVSALTGENIEELFTRLARMILTKIELGEIDPDDPQNGVQYGDTGGWDGASIQSGLSRDDNSIRRRKRGRGILKGVGGWDQVFRKPGRRSQSCC